MALKLDNTHTEQERQYAKAVDHLRKTYPTPPPFVFMGVPVKRFEREDLLRLIKYAIDESPFGWLWSRNSGVSE